MSARTPLVCRLFLTPGRRGPNVTAENLLTLSRGLNRLIGAAEGVEERVSLRVDLMSVVLREHLAQQPLVLRQYLAVAVAELPNQPGRPLNVREDKRHRAARQISHPGTKHATQSYGERVRNGA